MLAKLARLKATARRLFAYLVIGVEWIIDGLLKIWRWLNSLDIPLSPLQWILLFYLTFGLIYAVATPVFEANEELWHFGYVEHLRETGSLPVQNFYQRHTIYRHHGSQPPLYYGLMAIASGAF